MSTHTYTKAVDTSLLHKQIGESSIAEEFGIVSRDNDVIDVVFDTELSAGDITTLDALIDSHVKPVKIARVGTHNLLTFEKVVSSTTNTRVTTYVYEGTEQIGTPYEIQVLAYVDAGATGELRIYNKNDGVVVSTVTISNTEEQSILLPVDGSWPTSSTIMEVQCKKTSGTGKSKIYINGMVLGY